MKNNIGIIILVAIIAGGSGFFVGMKYQERQIPKIGQFRMENTNSNRTRGMMPRGGENRITNGFQPVNGEITAVDKNTLTVKLPDGSSKIVILPDSLKINKMTEVARDELITGLKITAFGKTNPDGSVTAESVQLNPLEIRFVTTPAVTN